MDVSKLTPAPWIESHGDVCFLSASGGVCPVPMSRNQREFIALARNAFDVMMRRGWWVVPYFGVPNERRWLVRSATDISREITQSEHADPFTALVEADKWYAANVEGK